MSEIKAREVIGDNSYHTKPVTGTEIGTKFGMDTVSQLVKSDGTSTPQQATENGATSIGNAIKKFRDGFSNLEQNAGPNSTIWSESFVNQGTGFRGRRGNAAGSSYMNISMCPLTAGFEYKMETIQKFKYPMRITAGYSISQRILGQEIQVAIVGCDDTGAVENLTPFADMPISGSIVVSSGVATINFLTAHPYKGGDRIITKNNADPRLNFGPSLVTVTSPTQITLPMPISISNNTYTATGGSCEWADIFGYAKNASGLINENTIATNSTWATRRNGYNTRLLRASNNGNTAALQTDTSNYSDAFNASGKLEFTFNQEEAIVLTKGQDNFSGASQGNRWSQNIPDEEKEYKISIRAKNLNNFTRPVAKIISISKSGTGTATVTTQDPHGLTTNSIIQINGVRDQTNFPNLTTINTVTSIISPTQFTTSIGSASTTTSSGGGVWLNEGSVTTPGFIAQVIQSISRTNNIITVVGHASWAGILPGENYNIYGCDATSMGLYDGNYKVLRVSGLSLDLESNGPDFGSINCGGAVIRRTDIRIHFISDIEYTRMIAELASNNGVADGNKGMPVLLLNSATVSSSALSAPIFVQDSSTVVTTNTTTTGFTQSIGSVQQFNMQVTAVSGTTPTFNLSIEESTDGGLNYFKIYDFPQVTANGNYNSPLLRIKGNRVRYVQTLTGTSPSFTRSLNRVQHSISAPHIVQSIDRTIVPNTLNSVTPALLVEGCQDFNIKVRCTAQTTPATIALQFSDNGTDWQTSSTTLATISGVASAKVLNEQWKFARLLVSVAGTGITLADATITGLGV